jgi:hypothetical protein
MKLIYLSTYILISAVLLFYCPQSRAKTAGAVVAPNSVIGLEETADGKILLGTSIVCWGPQWQWTDLAGHLQVVGDRERKMSQNIRISADQFIAFSYDIKQTTPDVLTINFTVSTLRDIDITGIAFAFEPAASNFSSVTVTPSGKEDQQANMPLRIGSITATDVSQIVLQGHDGQTTAQISPPRDISSEQNTLRLWLAPAKILASQPLNTTLTIHFPHPITFFADESASSVRDITPDWFPYSVGRYGTPVDLSFLNKDPQGNFIPAGIHGFVNVKGDDFVFADGTPARFWGVNVTAYAALTGGLRADQIAERLARLGVNIVRLHHLDSDWTPDIIDRHNADGTTQHLNPTSMDHLDKLIYELKMRGIYVLLDPWVGRSYLPGDEVPQSDHFDSGMYPYIFFDPRMQELHRKFLAEVWNHVNVYTHLAYKDDPAIALTEICNEFLYRENITLQPYRDEYYQLYLKWAGQNGADPIGDRIFTMNYPVDNQRFYTYIMKQFFASLHEYDRHDLGLKIPINDSNWFFWPWQIACQSDGDFMDSHFYYGGDRIGAGYGLGGLWVANPPSGSGTPFGSIGAMALLGKPMTSSEYGNNPPKTYRSAYYVGFAAIACLQSWDSFTAFAYSQGGQPAQTLAPYEMESDPATIASLAAGALIYRRQDVQPAKQLAVMTLPGNEQYAFHWENNGEKAFQNTAGFNVALETHKVGVVLGDESKIPPDVHPVQIMTPASAFADKPETTELRSYTGELWRDWKLAVGMINTPRTQAAYGKLGESHKAWQTTDCNFDISTPYATVVLSSLTNQPIHASNHLLLTAVARAENFGMSFDLGQSRVVNQGKAPVFAEPVVGTLRFKTTAAHLSAWTLGSNGIRETEIPLYVHGGEATLPLKASDETLFYDIVVK